MGARAGMGLGYRQMELARVAGKGPEAVDTVSERAEMDFGAVDMVAAAVDMDSVAAGTEPVESDTDSVAEMVLPGTDSPPAGVAEPLALAWVRLRS